MVEHVSPYIYITLCFRILTQWKRHRCLQVLLLLEVISYRFRIGKEKKRKKKKERGSWKEEPENRNRKSDDASYTEVGFGDKGLRLNLAVESGECSTPHSLCI
jgi:hypothetical protein